MQEVKTTLREVTEKLQALCHEGYSQYEVLTNIKGFTTAVIEDVKVAKESERVYLEVGI